MAIRRRKGPGDMITAEDLANFGRYEVLGNELSGVDSMDAYSLVEPLVSRGYSLQGQSEVAEELRRHAKMGDWEKVGAWKYVRSFLSDREDASDLVDGGLLAVSRMRMTNLAIHLGLVDLARYSELTGRPAANDGFFGPPVFDSTFGPSKQYYLDRAVASAAARRITRLATHVGAKPGPLEAAARSMWDFGMLIYKGPLLVNPDTSFEPNVVRPARDAATGVDHYSFAALLASAVLDESAAHYGVWSAIGGARFVEDYLAAGVAESPAHLRLADAGLSGLIRMGAFGVMVAPAILTRFQTERLALLRST